ncbi:MAG TPA: DNA internalization-related competence protein ComEC/Rec2, partial [bacterium]|nr:DNA internalization-related competence protein ComEC/Rec2 [bacterium]
DLAHRRRDPLREFLGRTVSIEGVVVRPPQVVMQETGSRTRVAVAVEVVSAPQRTRVNSTVLITLPGEMNPVYGDRIRVRGRLYRPLPAGNPGEVSYRDSLRASGIDAVMAVRRAAEVHTLSRGGGNPVLAAAYGLRARITVFFRAGLPGPAGALLASLLLGDDGAVSPGLRDAFRTAGLLHVLVVSGAQVVLVLGCMLWVGRLVRAPPRLATAAAAAGVAFFALMTGWVPSVGRATVMAMVGLAAVWLRRDRDVYTALAAAGIVLLIADPSLLFDLGFQLSFAATWGLLYVAPAMSPRLRGPQRLRGLVAMTVGAQLAVLPILAYHVGRLSAAGFLANLAVVPLVGVLVPAGFATAGVGLVVPPLGVAMLGVLRPILMVVIFLAEVFSRLPGATIAVAPPGLFEVVLLYAGLIATVEALRGSIRVTTLRIATAGCAVIAAVLWLQVASASPGHLVITVLDVGQGDAIVLQAPGGATMLIDGGGDLEGLPRGSDVGVRRVVPALRRLGVRRLDVVVLSHPHEDHAGGLAAVLKNFRVGLVLDAGLPHPAPGYVTLLRWIERTGIPYRLARRGMRLDLGGGVHAVVLHPEEPLLVGTGSDANLNSVVLRVTYGAIGVLFPGDLEAPIEWRLVDTGDDLGSTVLKVGHHGSVTSSTPEFLDAVRPAVAVISVGAWNPFGHPHRRTLEALADIGATIYRTDEHGAVTMTTDGRRLWIRTNRDAGDH